MRNDAIQLVDALAHTKGRLGMSGPLPGPYESASLLFSTHHAWEVGHIGPYLYRNLIDRFDLAGRGETHLRKVAPPGQGCYLPSLARDQQVQTLPEVGFVKGSVQERDRERVRSLVPTDPIQALPYERSRWRSLTLYHRHSIGDFSSLGGGGRTRGE